MAGHRFSGADRKFVGVIAKDLLDRASLAKIADVRRGGVGVDVINLVWGKAGMFERKLHGARGAFAVRWRSSHVVGVCSKSVAREFAVNHRAASFRVFQLFHYNNTCAFAHDKAIAITVERSRSALGLVVARAESSHGGETCKTNRDNRSLGASSEKNIGVAELNHPPRFANSVIRGRTGGDDAQARTMQPVLH